MGATMAKPTKTFPIGRLVPVEKAKANPDRFIVERMPKPGNGDTK